MPLKLAAPLYERFELPRTDKKYGVEGEPSYVIIRQARQGQHESRQRLFSTLERKYKVETPDEFSLVSSWSIEELRAEEVWLTLCESNLEDADGKPLFPSKMDRDGNPTLSMSKQAFMSAWGQLYADVSQEIHEKVLEVNPLWAGEEGEG